MVDQDCILTGLFCHGFQTLRYGNRQYAQHSLAAANDGWYNVTWQPERAVKRQRKVQKTADNKAKGRDISVRVHNKI